MKKKLRVEIMQELKELYYKDREEFHRRVKESSENLYESMYEILRELSKDTLLRYIEEGIPEEIFFDSMTDIDIWAEDYKKQHGRYGLKEYKWVKNSIDMKVFKIGRLQFELIEDEVIIQSLKDMGIREKIHIINTHIQAGKALDFDECQESYNKAAEFYLKREGNNSLIVFVCDSWLLNSKLQDLLEPESNIIRFQKQYKIISKDLNSRQMEKRVFGSLEANPENYDAKTTLQRKLREALMKGEKFGTSRGLFIFRKS